MIRTRRALALIFAGGAAVAAVALPALPAHAAADCDKGFVCVYPVAGMSPILIPEGESREFKGGVKATIANSTSVSYCVTGEVNYSLAAGAEVTDVRTITATGPNPGACLL